MARSTAHLPAPQEDLPINLSDFWVAVLLMKDGTETESVPLPTAHVAEQIARASLLDSDVAAAHVEHRVASCFAPSLRLIWRDRHGLAAAVSVSRNVVGRRIACRGREGIRS